MIKPTLKKLKEPVKKEMELFQQEFEKGIRSDVSLINTEKFLSGGLYIILPCIQPLDVIICGEIQKYSSSVSIQIEAGYSSGMSVSPSSAIQSIIET